VFSRLLSVVGGPTTFEYAMTADETEFWQDQAALLDDGKTVSHSLRPNRQAWLQIARGEVELNGQKLAEGDGAGIRVERNLEIRGRSADAELLLFDLG
jgi:redox-sensitive bicupin YhaK (pirin superfamily)